MSVTRCNVALVSPLNHHMTTLGGRYRVFRNWRAPILLVADTVGLTLYPILWTLGHEI